jgi:hypothetical protein
MRQRKTEVWAKWRGLASEQKQSGHSAAAFCRERGLKSGQFFAWKKRLREAEAARFVDVKVAPAAEAKRPASGMHSGAIAVWLSRGRSLVLVPGFEAHHLRALLTVLDGEA